MPAIQSTISQFIGIGAVGRRANMEEWNTVTLTAQTTAPATIGFAQPVKLGSLDKTAVIYNGSGVFKGLTEASIDRSAYSDTDDMPVCESGVMFGLAGGACTAGGAVGWSSSTGKYANAASGNITIPNAEFDSSATADGQVVRIRLRRIPGG